MGTSAVNSGEQIDRQSRILEAALDLLSRHGISGVSMRAVAREAGVALGLVNYYYDDKMSLIRAALRSVDEHDLALVAPDPSSAPDEQLRKALDPPSALRSCSMRTTSPAPGWTAWTTSPRRASSK